MEWFFNINTIFNGAYLKTAGMLQFVGSVPLTSICIISMMILGYVGAPISVWAVVVLGVAWGIGVPVTLIKGLIVFFVVMGIPIVRRYLITLGLFKGMKALKVLPTISETERVAIDAGTVWMDSELFSGQPNFKTLMSQPYPELTEEEQAFLDGPCETLCQMVQDWEVHRNRDFPESVWDYMKKEKFFGLIVPKKYGGLEFSALANSAVVAKLSARSTPLGITVMVPNSLGPAELLIHYGTTDQKDHYLPRLADGRDIPCFALTEPTAGSDAGAMTSHGVVFEGNDGAPWIRLSWKKRYITLAAISTVLGVAFKLRDPQNILGKGTKLGITCALIASSTKGVIIGRRHDPLGVPFYNCPTEGHNVEIPMDAVIGGIEGVGHGWRMLMESLSAGRGISLPANCSGGSKHVLRVISAYAAIRKQFGLAIGKFEGVEEKVSEIAGITYLLEAARRYTCGGLDSGAKPAVITAIAKYNFTELFRTVINHGMDIQGGAAISMGPRNLLAHAYCAAPISITVEGANILTRTLIVFGQGAIRCHPFVLSEIRAMETNNLTLFDKSFWGHVGHVIQNIVRLTWISLTRGRFIITPGGPLRRYYQKLSWASVQFAVFADIAMAVLGGQLKRKERLTGRFADVLSWLYLATAVLRRFEFEDRPEETRVFAQWSLQYAFNQVQLAFDGIFQNMGWVTILHRYWSRCNPIGVSLKDSVGQQLAQSVLIPGQVRDDLTDGIHVPKGKEEQLARLEMTLQAVMETDPYSKKVIQAVRKGVLPKSNPETLIRAAIDAKVLTQHEGAQLLEAEKLRRDVINVDDFSQESYINRR